MFTPQQIEQISFGRATFGGYDMSSVDEFLEPLTADYVTLYKENAVLKSKMRVLVGKLEEYRQNEASMKEAIVNAQRTCDMMVKEAEARCAQMLSDANVAAAENARSSAAMVDEENARVEEARRLAAARIDELQAQLNACIQALERIKEAHRPATAQSAAAPQQPATDRTDAVAAEISQSLEALVGTTESEQPSGDGAGTTGTAGSNTGRFGADLKFGRNYPDANR